MRAAFGEIELDAIVARMVGDANGGFSLGVPTASSAELLVSLVSAGPIDPWSPTATRFGVSAAGDLLVAVGDPQVLDAETARNAGREVAARVDARAEGEPVTIDLGLLGDATEPRTLVEAFLIGLRSALVVTSRIVVVLVPKGAATIDADLRRCEAVGDAIWFAAALTEAPGNLVTPETLAQVAREVAAALGIPIRVRERAQLEAEGFGSILAIGCGAAQDPRLVEVGALDAADAVVIVGKGVTFDSGGLSIKSAASMQDMRTDMAGAVAALGVVAALARCGDSTLVRAVMPLVENLPGPSAVKPGDVITSWNGTRIQIMDSDFEGRVILADGLALGSQGHPKIVVSVATLTHQARLALGDDITALLARDSAAGARLVTTADKTGDPMWMLPWATRYRSQIRVSETTVRNHPMAPAGRAITAALFLGEFVPEEVPYLHLDIGATAWVGDGSTGHATGAVISALAAFAAEYT